MERIEGLGEERSKVYLHPTPYTQKEMTSQVSLATAGPSPLSCLSLSSLSCLSLSCLSLSCLSLSLLSVRHRRPCRRRADVVLVVVVALMSSMSSRSSLSSPSYPHKQIQSPPRRIQFAPKYSCTTVCRKGTTSRGVFAIQLYYSAFKPKILISNLQ